MSPQSPRGAAPLTDRDILLTREEDGGGSLAGLLQGAGARVRNVPFTRTAPPDDRAPLEQAARDLPRYDWVVLTSARAVKALAAHGAGRPGSVPGQKVPLWACVGPATAAALTEHLGQEANLVPDRFDAATLAEAILRLRTSKERLRVLFPAAENARAELPSRLRQSGMDVTQVVAYRTVPSPPSLEELLPPDPQGTWDSVVFTSGLVVELFLGVLSEARPGAATVSWLEANNPAVLGLSAQDALRKAGVRRIVRASRPTAGDLVESLIRLFTDGGREG